MVLNIMYDMYEDELAKGFPYEEETHRVLKNTSKANINRVFSYEECDIDFEFIGFLHSYKDLSERLPKDFTIIDIGAAYAMQSEYFKDFKNYIAVEPSNPEEAMSIQLNMDVFSMTGEEFIKTMLPRLQEMGCVDLDKTFCICSYVPDKKLRNEIIPEAFPYYRSTYAGCKTHERLPECVLPYSKETLEKPKTKHFEKETV